MANENPTKKSEAPQQQDSSAKERRFLVKEDARVPRGGSHFTLPKGKVISSLGYDIAALRNQGVKLEEVQAA
jgi:hypothetical protein